MANIDTSLGDDGARVQQIARVVLEVVEKHGRKREPHPNRWLSLLGFATGHWQLVVVVGSLISLLLAWKLYGVSPLLPLKKIAREQAAYKDADENRVRRERTVARHIRLGDVFLGVSQLDAAKTEFSQALGLDTDNAEAQLGLLKADVFAPIKERRDADVEIIDKRIRFILEENPGDAHAHAFRGQLLQQISPADAEAEYRTALQRNGNLAMAHFGLGVLLDEQKRNAEALDHYRKAAELSPWNLAYVNNLAYQYLQRHEKAAAIERYEQVLRLDGSYLLSYFTLATAYSWRGDFERSLHVQDELLKNLEDASISDRPQNANPWFFHTNGPPIYFHTIVKKKCYALWSAAMTAFLMHDAQKSDALVVRALGLREPREPEVEALLRYDIAQLTHEQPALTTLLESFSGKYLDRAR